MSLKRTPMNRGKGLTRKAPMPRAAVQSDRGTIVRDRTPTYTPPERIAVDLTAAAAALAHQAESAAQERRPHAPVPEVSQRAPKPSNTGFPPAVRTLILGRDDGECWRCGQMAHTIGVNLQHRDNRGNGGTTDPRINLPGNGLVLCGSGTTGCHGWAEHNPRLAEALGYAVAGWADYLTVPAFHHRLGWMQLDNNGARFVAPEPTNGDAHTVARRKEPVK